MYIELSTICMEIVDIFLLVYHCNSKMQLNSVFNIIINKKVVGKMRYMIKFEKNADNRLVFE